MIRQDEYSTSQKGIITRTFCLPHLFFVGILNIVLKGAFFFVFLDFQKELDVSIYCLR